MAVQIERWHFTADEYHRMVEAGIFNEDDRIELIGGEIVAMTPIGIRHAACVKRLIALLSRYTGQNAILDVQNPILLDDESEPQPDIILMRPRDDFYASSLPMPADILLLVEVSDSTLLYDRTYKLPLYAKAGISEVWIIDLQGDTVEVYREPANGEYKVHSIAKRGDDVAPINVPQANLSVDAILGAAGVK